MTTMHVLFITSRNPFPLDALRILSEHSKEYHLHLAVEISSVPDSKLLKAVSPPANLPISRPVNADGLGNSITAAIIVLIQNFCNRKQNRRKNDTL